MEEYVDSNRHETRYLNQDELLSFIHETTYNITEQLFDNLGGKIDTQVITVTHWKDEEHTYDETGAPINSDIIDIERINNTRFFETSARNDIFTTCDSIVDSLRKQYDMHEKASHAFLVRGLVMKLQYRINKSHEKTERTKKHKGDSYINHFDVPCFTNKVRTNCITRMNNFNTKRESTYIYNIVNPNDNLCFLRYVILIKFLSAAGQRAYLNKFHIPQILPLVNPENLGAFIPFIPFVRPNGHNQSILRGNF